MKPLISVIVLLFLVGCVGPFDRSPMTRSQLKEWYAEWVQRPGDNGPGIGYRGSDAHCHYFMARSIDKWVFVRTLRSEIELPETQPVQRVSIGPVLAYYWIDPSKNFEMLPSTSESKK